MPRIYTSTNDPLDFCLGCFPEAIEADEEYGSWGDGNDVDDRGNCFSYDEVHPEYEGEGYRCYTCKCELTDNDN